jgi:hypothetical protein
VIFWEEGVPKQQVPHTPRLPARPGAGCWVCITRYYGSHLLLVWQYRCKEACA